MKIRNGFVSNSSSSSFIIASKGSDKGDLTFQVTMDLSDCIQRSIATVEALNDYFLEEYGYRQSSIEDLLKDEDYLRDRYDTCVEQIRAGNTVHFGRASNDDYEGAGLYIYSNGLPRSNAFTVIQDDR